MVVSAAEITPLESRARNKNHPETLLSALRSSFKEKDVIEIIAKSGARILFNKKLLVLFSRTIRKCLEDLPCCVSPSSITLVDINIRALKKVKEILDNSLHDVTTEFNQDHTEEVVQAARALGIEMKNIKVSPTTGKAKKKMKNSGARKSSVSTANLADEEVTKNIKSGRGMMEEQVMDFYDYDDRPLEISVDVSDDEDNLDDEDAEEYDTALEGTIFRSNRDDTNLLHDYLEDDDESLHERSKQESEKISFSFLSGIDSANTSTEIPLSKTFSEPRADHNKDVTAALNENVPVGSASIKDASSLSEETEPLTTSEAMQAASDLRCDLCGRPQRGPSALREHYSITHFFEVNRGRVI